MQIRCVIALWVGLVAWTQACFALSPASLKLDVPQTDDGYFKGWLVLGPFPASSAPDGHALSEAIRDSGPSVGDEYHGRSWSYLPTNDRGRLNFQVLAGGSNVSAFAACVVDVKTATDAVLSLGSDDGARVWINGELLHEALGPRSLQLDQDRIPIRLPEGASTILIQVMQGGGDWLMAARFIDTNGRPLHVDSYCTLRSDARATVIPAWNGESRELTIHLASLAALTDPRLRVKFSSARQDIEEIVKFSRPGKMESRVYPLPWVAALTQSERVEIDVIEQGRSVANTSVDLWPTYVPDRKWLDEAVGTDDPWLLARTVGTHPKLADAFVGNGYYGFRLSATGTTAPYDRPRCKVAGIYAEGERVVHPRWANVDLQLGEHTYRPKGRRQHYRQTLDLKRCRLTTEDRWVTPAGELQIQLEVIPHRTRRNLLMMRYHLTADSDCTLEINDVLDASCVPERQAVELRNDDVMTIQYRIPDIELREVVAACWRLPPAATTETAAESDTLRRRVKITLRSGEGATVERYALLATAVGPEESLPDPVRLLNEAVSAGFDTLADEHFRAWSDLWTSDVVVPNQRLQQMIRASLFHSYCNLRNDYPWSLGPVGMAGDAWRGRVFWDADLWVFPPLALLQPKVSRAIVEYRYNTLEGARVDAASEGRGGAKWAWESARTGQERCPWPPAIEQRHIQNDVAYAQWIYSLCSGDEDYLRDKALPVITASADYWCDRVTYNREFDRYEIHNVLGADEYAENIDNNTTTNYGAAYTLRLADRLNRRFGRKVRPEWKDIAGKMFLPFDQEKRIYKQHDAYAGEQIKQADTSLAIYPWEMEMPQQVKENILGFYPAHRPPTPIMMSAAIYCIAFSEIGDRSRAERYFNELIPYFWFPYLLASESENRLSIEADSMVVGFATGQGGFLQAIINGFAGVRVRDDGLLIQPALPDWLPWMEIRGMHFDGETIDCRIEDTHVELTAEEKIGFRVYNREGTDYPVSAR